MHQSSQTGAIIAGKSRKCNKFSECKLIDLGMTLKVIRKMSKQLLLLRLHPKVHKSM